MTRVAVIGTGFGARVVAPAWRNQGAEVEVLSSRADDIGTALRRSKPHIVSVHSPPYQHATHVRLGIDSGALVLCDKPTTPSAPTTAQLIDALGADAERVAVNFEFRFEPARREMVRHLRSGLIGEVRRVVWVHRSAGSMEPMRPYGWLFDASLGGGWIGAWASHAVDALHGWLGEPLTVRSSEPRIDVPVRFDTDGVSHDVTAEDGLIATLESASGVEIQIDSSFASVHPRSPKIVIEGTLGTITNHADRRLVIDHPFGATTETIEYGFASATGLVDRHAAPMDATVAALMARTQSGAALSDDGVEADLGSVTALATLDDGLRVDRVLDELRAGRAV